MKTRVDYAFEILSHLLDLAWIVGLVYVGWRIAHLDDVTRWAYLYFLLVYLSSVIRTRK